MRAVFLSLLCLQLVFPVRLRADDEPVVNGLKKSEWIKLLDDPKLRNRRAAVVALGIIGPLHKGVVPALAHALRDKEMAVRNEAIQILSGMDRKDLHDLVPDFADLLKDDPNTAIRQQTANLLGRIGPEAKPALNRLIIATNDKELSVRIAATEAIGKIGPDAHEAVTNLLPLLKDKEASIRLAAVFSLGRIGLDNDAQIETLTKLLSGDSSADVRKEVARSIGMLEIQGKSAIPSLTKSLKTEQVAEVRQQIALALGKIGPDILTQKDALLIALKSDSDKTVRLFLLRSLSSSMSENLVSILPDLTQLLKVDPEGEIRLAIIQEISNMGVAARSALPALIQAQQDVQIAVRDAARATIKKIQDAIAKMPKENAGTSKSSAAKPPEDPNAPTQDLKIGDDPKKRYFLIGPKPAEKDQKMGLLIVLPGGTGDESFLPFVKSLFKDSLPKNFLIAQLVAPKWTEKQEIVWPTRKLPASDMKFATEEFIQEVITDVEKKFQIDPERVLTLSWSSGGPAAYFASLSSKKIKGSLIAMSVFKPELLPQLSNAKGHRYYLLHSPDDETCPYPMAKKAQQDLTAQGAKVELVDYEGMHGWPSNALELIHDGLNKLLSK